MLRKIQPRTLRHLTLAWLLALLGACSNGTILDPVGSSSTDADGDGIPDSQDSTPNGPGSGPDGGGAGPGGASCMGAACDTEGPAASSAFPRLSHTQWANSVTELLQLDAPPDVTGFTNDAPTGTLFDNNGGKLEVASGLWGDYQKEAERLAAELSTDTARLAKLAPADATADAATRTRSFLSDFGLRAYRRPLTKTELDSHAALFAKAAALFPEVDAFTAGVQLSVQAMLQTPEFIYRIETGSAPGSGGEITLNDYELASRLSFMLWDSMPDAQLFAKAKANTLHDPDVLRAEAKRMLEDARAGQKLVEFHRQLLELRRYDTLHPAGLPDGIGAAMREETERFVRDVVVAHDGNLKTLLTASYSFVNADLAELYGLSGSYTEKFQRAELDPKVRSGLITQPGFLSYRSGATAPILRGVFLNLKVLCADLPPPPVFTPPMMTGITRRERVESVTGKGTCGESCHARMINPAGFPLEHFDDVGRYREKDQGQPIDASAEYMFRNGTQSYDGPIEWGQTIAASAEAHECYVKHWLEFGYGRGSEKSDAALIARVAEESRTKGVSVKEILIALVESPSFRTRLQAN